MTMEEAIKRLEWLRMVGNHVDSVTLGKDDMPHFDMAISALREQPRWISVDERLPEDGVDVLTRRAVGMSVEAHCGWGWTEDGYHTKWRVTHWMPLPEAPEVEA